MITGSATRGASYIFTSVPQIPATPMRSNAPSSGTSGIGNSWSSIRPAPTRTAASTRSAVNAPPSRSRWHALRVSANLAIGTLALAGDPTGGTDDGAEDGRSQPGEQRSPEGRIDPAGRVLVRVRGGARPDPRVPPDGPRPRVGRARDGVRDVPVRS